MIRILSQAQLDIWSANSLLLLLLIRTKSFGQLLNFVDRQRDLGRIRQQDFDLPDPVTPIRVVDHDADVVLQI